MSEAKEFTVTRTFNAPIEAMWKAWSDPAEFPKWWGPKGCDLEVTKFEFKPGGVFHYAMNMPHGQKWWGRFLYREIEKPSRIVFLSSFANEAAEVVRAPFNALFPLEIRNVLTFTEAGGKTTLTLRGGPIDPTPDERAFYEGMFGSMQQGFGGTFDQLEAFLAGS